MRGPILLLLLVAAILFAPFWLQGMVFVPGDFLGFIYPWKAILKAPIQNLDVFDVTVFFYPQDVFLNQSLKAGELPLWNPNIFSGHPIVGSGQSALLYPPRLLAHYWFSPAIARTLIISSHVTLSGLTMLLWLRGRGLNPWAAAVGGLTWMLSGQNISWMEFEHAPAIAVFLPLILWGIDRGLEGYRQAWIGVALAAALSLQAGHLQMNLYPALIVTVYGWCRVLSSSRPAQQALCFTLAGLATLAMASPTLGPFLELLSRCQRVSFDAQQLQTMASGLPALLATLVCPDILGNPARGFMFNRCPANLIYPEFADFVGLAPLLLALAAVLAAGRGPWSRRETLAWAAAALLALLMASASPIYTLLVTVIPSARILIPGRFLVLFCFSAAVLAALGSHSYLADKRRSVTRMAGLMAVAWLPWMVWVDRVLAQTPAQFGAWVAPWMTPLTIKIPPVDLGPETIQAAARHAYLDNPQHWMPLAVALGLVAMARLPATWRGPCLALLSAADLLTFAIGFNPTCDPSSLFPPTPALTALRADPGLHRIDKREAGYGNCLVVYGQQLLAGYESLISRRYYETLQTADPSERLPMRAPVLDHFGSPLLDAMNVKYLITSPRFQVHDPGWVPRYQGPDANLYENLECQPRARILGRCRRLDSFESVRRALTSPNLSLQDEVLLEGAPEVEISTQAAGAPVRVLDYRNNRVVLEAALPAPGVLLLADAYDPGWRALVDGQQARVYPANGCARGLCLGPGRHLVEFVYWPKRFGLYLALCGSCLAAGLVGLVVSGRKRWDIV